MNSEVWRVELARGMIIARFWKIERQRGLAAEYAHALGLVAELGLPAPRLLDTDFSEQTAAAHDFRVTVEEHLAGRHLEAKDLADHRVVEQIAAMLTQLHGMTGEVAGRPWSRRNREHPWEAWMTKRPGVLVGRARRLGLADRSTANHLRAWFAARRPALTEVSPFCLVHGDVQPANLLIDESGRVALIDFGTLGFAPRALDLASAQNAFDLVAPGAFAPVLEAYLGKDQGPGPKDQGPRTKDQSHGTIESLWQSQSRYFCAFDQLRRAVSAQRKVGKRRHAGRRDVYGHKADFFWRQLLETTDVRGAKE